MTFYCEQNWLAPFLMKTICVIQVVVVSRWYGGIQLGPDRFKHINNAARLLLGSWGYIAGVNSSAPSNQKTLPKSNLQKGKSLHNMFLWVYLEFPLQCKTHSFQNLNLSVPMLIIEVHFES